MTDWRDPYRLHARLPVHRRRIGAAKVIVQRALADHPGTWAVSASGGKDSTALVSVCIEAGWRGPLYHVAYPELPEENAAVVHRLAERFGLPFLSVTLPGQWDAFERLGRFFARPETPEERLIHREIDKAWREGIDRGARDAGLTGLFFGFRAAESRGRRMMLARQGAIYRTRDRSTVTACPLARWEAADVWARIVAGDLPYLARYDALEDRETDRSEWTWDVPGLWLRGQGRVMRQHDPALWARLCERWPSLAVWG